MLVAVRALLHCNRRPTTACTLPPTREPHIEGYREWETRIDGRRAYVQTFSPNQKQREEGRTYGAGLLIVTKEWAPFVELRVTFTGGDASDLRVAERVFASIQFPAGRVAPR